MADSMNRTGVRAPEAAVRAEPIGTEDEQFDFLKLSARLGDGETVAFDAVPGMHLVELMRASGIPIKAECGGAGACATCHIRIVDTWQGRVPKPDTEELDKLDEIPGADEHSRLACQIRMTEALDGLEFVIQTDSLTAAKIEAAE